jgi:uncharacterized protein YndB with AHSA1/START domain
VCNLAMAMRNHDMEIEIDATAGQVWEAVSTSQGFASWFAPVAEVTPGPGGSVFLSWGPGMEDRQRIEAWEPNRHLQIAQPRAKGGPPNVVDYSIEERGGKTVMRLVHSGFESTPDLDAEFESTGDAWRVFLKMMKHSVEHGVATCRNVTVFRMLPVSRATAWEKLTANVPELRQGVSGHFRADSSCCAVEFPDRNHALLSVFCGSAREKSMLTLTWLLYGATAPEAEKIREHWTAKIDGMFK